ncbi:DUF3426 domain-containing protein [Lentisalinibacter orientalis]|uniref:DUF3426 domain-containing protein n=1 Tax=Lentisalinibacter orientalis TaxID=2992241 RepID=UPI0038691F09
MYTQCTECRTVYQIGPEDLKRAHGRVRCGACGTVFDALETLSHEPPQPAEPPAPEPESIEEPAPELGAEAGPEPEPESEPKREPEPETDTDTDTESAGSPAEEAEWTPAPAEEPEELWQVAPETGSESEFRPETGPEAEPEPEAEAEPEHEPEPEGEPEREPQRFDDDTPLEEILASFGGELSAETDEEEGEQRDEAAAAGAQTDRPTGEPAEPTLHSGDEAGETGDLGDEDEWRALLAELELDETALGAGLEHETDDENGARAAQPPEAEAPSEELTLVEEPAETRPEAAEPTGTVEPEAGEPPAGQAVPETAPETPEHDRTDTAETETAEEESERPAAEDRDDLAASAALFDEIVQSGEFAAILRPDSDAVAAAVEERGREDREESQSATESPRELESETAGGAAGEQPEEIAEEEIIDQTLLPRRRSRSRTLLWSAAALLLVAALGAQVIHGQRAQLATHPEFGPRLQQIYGLFGVEVQPRWDIGALCVESSGGDASADSLQITSVIVHQGDRPQPYPLLHVSLTDRWQSVIGSRSVEAGDYLPEGELRDVRMHPGERVRARARLSDPGSEAAGYELHVCYRGAEGDLRCSGACR